VCAFPVAPAQGFHEPCVGQELLGHDQGARPLLCQEFRLGVEYVQIIDKPAAITLFRQLVSPERGRQGVISAFQLLLQRLTADHAVGDLLQCPDYCRVIRLDRDVVTGSLYPQVAAQNATIEHR
jgi:hypothetical protein